jgi:acetyl esterase/lipase
VEFVDVDENVLGDFNIDDMVRHIGIFTKYLALHVEYHANLDSVLISGGSAGGQLTIASGLALSSGKYSDILDSRLKIKGIIPFYPANGLSQALGIGGANELTNPSALVDANSPPCLIYQGTHDGLVDPEIASDFRDTYVKAGNTKCALLSMPFGSHGSDYYYSGYYNQVFMYYMERFMYQFR